MATREFWEEQHRKANVLWLTHSNPLNVIRTHGLTISPDVRVLDIGVGSGGFARWCHRQGNKVVSCDISEKALDKVKDVADTVLIDDIGSIGVVDLAVCHLVFQHCTDEQILHILNNVRLSHRGLFSFQYANKVGMLSNAREEAERNGLLYFRDHNTMDTLISKAINLKIAWRSGAFFPSPTEKAISWEVIHCEANC